MTFATWIYKRLLDLYPADFRRMYGREMTGMFRSRATDAWMRRGRIARVWFVMREFLGLIVGAVSQGARSNVSAA